MRRSCNTHLTMYMYTHAHTHTHHSRFILTVYIHTPHAVDSFSLCTYTHHMQSIHSHCVHTHTTCSRFILTVYIHTRTIVYMYCTHVQDSSYYIHTALLTYGMNTDSTLPNLSKYEYKTPGPACVCVCGLQSSQKLDLHTSGNGPV